MLNKTPFFIIGGLLFVAILLGLVFAFSGTKLYSRMVMEHAEKLVSEDMQISPTEAARVYALVSTLYFQVLQKEQEPGQAIVATSLLVDQIFPTEKHKTTKFLTSLNLNRDLKLKDETKDFFEKFLTEEKLERENKINYKIEINKNRWSGEKFLGVEVINYKNRILDKELSSAVPMPPAENSDTQKMAILTLIETTKHISTEQAAWVNYWSAMHMTPSLAGVWQDRLFTISRGHFLKDKEYAYAQMVLAQSLHDTMKETWTVKAKYLTKRPSLYSSEITLAMEDPQYPSYPSEYSSVGKVASEIISKFFPRRRNLLMKDQEVSGSISQWAGCSFSYDETAGKLLGDLIFQEIQSTQNLQPIRNSSLLPDLFYTLKTRINNFTSEAHVYNWGE